MLDTQHIYSLKDHAIRFISYMICTMNAVWYLYFVMLTCRMKHKQSKANTILPFSDHNDLLTTRVFELRTVQGLLGIMTVWISAADREKDCYSGTSHASLKPSAPIHDCQHFVYKQNIWKGWTMTPLDGKHHPFQQTLSCTCPVPCNMSSFKCLTH